MYESDLLQKNDTVHHLLLESTSATMLSMHRLENAASIVAKWASMTPAGWLGCGDN